MLAKVRPGLMVLSLSLEVWIDGLRTLLWVSVSSVSDVSKKGSASLKHLSQHQASSQFESLSYSLWDIWIHLVWYQRKHTSQ